MKEVFTGGMVGMLLGTLIYFGPDLREHFGTRYGDAERKVFETTKSHVHGTIQNLSRMRLEYKTTGSEVHRAALREMILIEVSTFDKTKLPNDLYQFINSL